MFKKNIGFNINNKKLFIRRAPLNLHDFINIKNICGIKLDLTGRLKGVKRARKVQLTKGIVRAQTFSFSIQTKSKSVQTKWGKLGLCISLGQI